MKRLSVLYPVLLLAATACVTHRQPLYIGTSNYVLAAHERPGGTTETYSIDMGGRAAALRVSTEYDKQRPFLGLQVLELDKQAAESRSLEPYSGLLVKGTYVDSSARAAGVRAGDILLSIDGRETIYLSQLTNLESELGVDQEVVGRVRRDGKTIDVLMKARMLSERISGTESVALESVKSRKPYAGASLRGIPSEWCAKIYGKERNAVLVASVEVGSPAWLAGLRGGDVIDEVDGRPVPPLASLVGMIRERGEAGEPMRVRVSRGGEGSYEATVALHDYSGETNFWVPLVVDLENGVYADRWSVGPFGLVMSNRNRYVTDTATREVDTNNVFSALLGLIRFETSPDRTNVRLLWFIRFDT